MSIEKIHWSFGRIAGIVKNTEVQEVNDCTLVLSLLAANIIYPNVHRAGVVENVLSLVNTL